jgi:sec-independent protein translocase protein TatA
MFGSVGTPELFLILAIVVLLFGIGRVSRVGGEMGSAIREFRKGLKGDDQDETTPDTKKLP